MQMAEDNSSCELCCLRLRKKKKKDGENKYSCRGKACVTARLNQSYKDGFLGLGEKAAWRDLC